MVFYWAINITGGIFMFGFQSAPEAIMYTIVIVISLTIHELSHGLVSYLQGDSTAKDQGRLTLNPIPHIDPFGIIAIYLIHFGWAKPVPINPNYYKNRRLGIILTSLAGPFSNLLLAFIGVIIYQKINTYGNPIIIYFVSKLVEINVTLAVFNLIPIPPLDGSKIFAELCGGKISEFIYNIERMGMLIIFALLWLQPVNNALFGVIDWVINGLFNFAILLHIW